MLKSYYEFRQKVKGDGSSLRQWLGEAVVVVVTTAAAWALHKFFPLNVIQFDLVIEEWMAPIAGLLAGGLYAYFHHRRLQWKAAWQIINHQQETIDDKNSLLIGTDLEPDLVFEVAIQLIKQISPKHNYTNQQVEKKLFEKAFNGAITVWGKPVLTNQGLSYDDVNFVKIPYQFFYSPQAIPNDARGYALNIGTPLRGWNGWKGRNKFFFVTVNRKQIVAKFTLPMVEVF